MAATWHRWRNRLRDGRTWRRVADLGSSDAARALRDSMLWLTPYLMVLSTVLLLAELFRLAGAPRSATVALEAGATGLRDALPLALWGATGAVRALQWRLPRTAVAFVCFACGLLCDRLLVMSGPTAQAFSVPLGLLAPLAIVPWIGWLVQRRWLQLWSGESPAGDNVGESVNLIFPSLIVVASVVCGLGLLLAIGAPMARAGAELLRLPPAPSAEVLAAAYALGNSALWLLGVHGFYALLPLLEAIPAASAGEGIVNQSFLGVFVFIGGSGATASLLLAILWVGRQRRHRVIAMASVAPAVINVNELLLFGLPVILHPRMVVPFVAAPLCNLLLAWAATRAGLVPVLRTDLPFNSPMGLNALLAGGGSLAPLVMQAVNVLAGALVYAPFVLRWQRAMAGEDAAAQSALQQVFGHRFEALAMALDDPVSRLNEVHRSRASIMDRLTQLQHRAMCVHYQPQVDPLTGDLVGCEALLRVHDDQQQAQPPGDLLAVLGKAALLPELDLWVLSAVSAQVRDWQGRLPARFRVAVNVSPCTFTHASAVERLVQLAAPMGDRLVIEITEETFLGAEQVVVDAIQQLRRAGVRIHIDDFGTGYSSLNYLHRFAVDGIKMDKSFTDTLAAERGSQVFSGICALAHSLDLEVVVEGVESAWQLDRLPAQPGLTVQGWLYGRALAPADLGRLMDAPLKVTETASKWR